MFGALNISTSGLIAERTRMAVISSNIANSNSLYNAQGKYDPYRRRITVFAPGDPSTGSPMGVHVAKIMLDKAPFRKVYEPGNPNADKQGYVDYPNVDPTMAAVNALEASRAYEANITAAQATKAMLNQSLSLLA